MTLKRPLLLHHEKQWYALYTRSRAEKKLNSQLMQKGIECFLPLKKVLRQYSDRKKWIEEPLIRSYLFVRVDDKQYYEALNETGAVRYVCFENKAIPIPDTQIRNLQQLVYQKPLDLHVEPGKLVAGNWVKIGRGPFKGIEGELVHIRGKHRLLLRFHTLGICVHTEIGLQDVQRLYTTPIG